MPSLHDLPLELVGCITESLCVHCAFPPSCQCSSRCINVNLSVRCDTRRGAAPWDRKALPRALAALCLTSRRLKDAAIRHLYHHPKTEKWWLLARTLLRQPDLARHVKTLHFPECLDRGEKSAIPSEVLAYYHTQLDSYSASLPEDQFRQRLEHKTCGWDGRGINDIVSMITSLCPMVETIDAVVSYPVIFHLCPPASLQSLQSVELEYYDTEYGIPLRSLVPLFKAAPNLSIIRCRSVSDEAGEDLGMALETVKKAEFSNSAMSVDALRILLKSFPGLEMFGYEAGGACVGCEQFNPSQARDLLMEHGRRLKRVVLDLAEGEAGWGFWEDGWEEWDEEETKQVVEGFKKRGIEFEVTGIC